MSFALVMALACALDAAFGWPDRLYRRIGHPVVWIGAVIAALELRHNDGEPAERRRAGTLCVVTTLAVVLVPTLLLQIALPGGAIGHILAAVLVWPFIAIRSMHDHVAAVARPLVAGDLMAARQAVAMIVGRDPARLDHAGTARAALESLAENTSDGIVAPVFWGVIAGLPGIAVYKAINTLDSMIGHRNERFEDFGRSAARLDDLVNLIPARLTGVLFAVVSRRPRKALTTMRRDAHHHRSPNAGWPEAAMAGALDIRLSGPRIYGDLIADEPWVNEGAPDPTGATLAAGLGLYRRAMLAMGLVLLAIAAI